MNKGDKVAILSGHKIHLNNKVAIKNPTTPNKIAFLLSSKNLIVEVNASAPFLLFFFSKISTPLNPFLHFLFYYANKKISR